MNFISSKIKQFSLLSIALATSSSILLGSIPALAEGYCQVQEEERTLFSHPVENLNQKIQAAMKSAKLEGEVKKIIWAKGLQNYEIKDDKQKVFAPSADLFPLTISGEGIVIFSHQKIGSHYKVNSPAWEFPWQRLVAEEVTKIEGAGKEDAPWLAVKTDIDGYHILRIETRGGVLPEKNCDFEGLLGVQYETLYIIVQDDNSRASQSRISNR